MSSLNQSEKNLNFFSLTLRHFWLFSVWSHFEEFSMPEMKKKYENQKMALQLFIYIELKHPLFVAGKFETQHSFLYVLFRQVDAFLHFEIFFFPFKNSKKYFSLLNPSSFSKFEYFWSKNIFPPLPPQTSPPPKKTKKNSKKGLQNYRHK